MTEKPFKDEDVVYQNETHCYTKEGPCHRLWVNRSGRWCMDDRVPAIASVLLNHIQGLEKECEKLVRLMDLCGAANRHDPMCSSIRFFDPKPCDCLAGKIQKVLAKREEK